ncbi:MAG: hypothetical protein ACYS0D_02310 [Planctomycetota bacterium]|jgi:hypothetical protein
MQLKGVISGHKVRTPLINMTKDEEAWLEKRFKMLMAGEHPRGLGELKPYPQQTGGRGGSAGPMTL